MASCRSCGSYGGFQPSIPGQKTVSLGIPGLAVLTQSFSGPGIAVLTQGGYGRLNRRGGYAGADDAKANTVDLSKVVSGNGGTKSIGGTVASVSGDVRDVLLGIFGRGSDVPTYDPTVVNTDENQEAPSSAIGPIVAVAGIAVLAIGAYALTRPSKKS